MKYLNHRIIFTFLMLLFTSIMQATTTSYKLENGLNVVLLHDPNTPIVSIKAVVRIGSIYEKEYLGTGISHYLEHLVAGGSTQKHSEEEYKTILSNLGGVSNAYTTTDHTAYFINTTPEKINTALNTIYEWLFFNTLKRQEVDREKKVITREIEKNQESISRRFYYLSQENSYNDHPSRIPVIGYLDQFLQIEQKDLEKFYKQNYIASNMTLIIGGNIDIDTLKPAIESTFGSQPRKVKPTFTSPIEPLPFTKKTSKHELKMNSTLISLRFLTTDLYSDSLYALDLLDYILGNGTQSLLYKKLVDELNLAFSIYTSSYTPAYTKGYFEIYIDTEEKNINQAIDETLKVINIIKTKSLPKKIIEKAKKQKIAENILNISSIEDKISKISMSMLYSQTPDFFDVYTNNFKKITAKELKQTAQKYFDTSKLITTIATPKKDTSKKTTKQKNISKPIIKKIELPNGLRIILHPTPKEKFLKLQILTKAGLLAETKQNNGIGFLTAKLLGKGTSKYNKEKIQTTFEENGAFVEGNLGNNTLYYTLECLKEDTNQLAPLFFETFFDATFSKANLAEEKRKLKNIIAQRNDDWYSYGNHIFKQEFWKTHPYSMTKVGELNSIKNITNTSITTYFKSLQNPKNMIISVYGSFNETDILKLITSYQEHLTSKFNQHTTSKVALTSSKTLDINYKFGTTSLFMGFQGTAITNPQEKTKLDLIDAILSGMSYPGGRLHNKLRDKGYVYLVHGINFNGIDTGAFYIYALTNEQSIEDVKNIITTEIEDIKRNPVSDEEFEEAIERIKYHYKDQRSSIDNQILLAATNELYTNNLNYSNILEEIIEKLTKEDIIKTAKTYLNYPQTIVFHPQKEN